MSKKLISGKSPLIFKNELGKEVKIQFMEEKASGLKGARNEEVKYKGVRVKLTSVDHNLEVLLTKKELDKLRSHSAKFFKEVGRKSELM